MTRQVNVLGGNLTSKYSESFSFSLITHQGCDRIMAPKKGGPRPNFQDYEYNKISHPECVTLSDGRASQTVTELTSQQGDCPGLWAQCDHRTSLKAEVEIWEGLDKLLLAWRRKGPHGQKRKWLLGAESGPWRTDSKDAGPHAHNCESLVFLRDKQAWKKIPSLRTTDLAKALSLAARDPSRCCCSSSLGSGVRLCHAVDSSTPGSSVLYLPRILLRFILMESLMLSNLILCCRLLLHFNLSHYRSLL